MSVVSGRFRLPDVEWPVDATRRPGAGAPPTSQRPDGDRAVHAVEGDGRCRRRTAGCGHSVSPVRFGDDDRAGLVESRRRMGAFGIRSAPRGDGAVRVHDRRRRRRWRHADRIGGNALQGMDADQPADRRQRSAADADRSGAGHRHGRDRHDPRRRWLERRRHPRATTRTPPPTPRRPRAMGKRRPQLDHRAGAVWLERRSDANVSSGRSAQRWTGGSTRPTCSTASRSPA